jgi:hypothetical protein
MSFKEKLKQLLDTSYYPSNNPDKELNFTILNMKRLIKRNKSNSQLNNKLQLQIPKYIPNDFTFFNSKIHSYHSFSNHKNQSNDCLFSLERLKIEKNIPKINTILRSFTLKDIHNKSESINLNKSYSTLDINETERSNCSMKKKIELTKKSIGLNDSMIHLINKPFKNFNLGLTKCNNKNIVKLDVRSKINFFKKRFINYPKSKILKNIKSNSISSFRNSNRKIENNINNSNNKILNCPNSLNNSILLKRKLLYNYIKNI